MTDVNQSGGRWVPNGDIPVKNYASTTAIPSGTAVLWDATAGNTGTSQQAPGIFVPASAGAITGTAGVLIDTLVAAPTATTPGAAGRLRRMGSAVCVADGTIAAGAKVMVSSTSGKMGRVKTYTGGAEYLGDAPNGAADGDPVLVEISIGKGA